jgi:hypothetical protein
MEPIIASYLFLHQECILPGIGTLKIVTTSASADYARQEMKPPVQNIVFVVDEKSPSVANELLTASQLVKIKLDNDGTAHVRGIGTFTRDKEGLVRFTPIELNKAYTPVLKVPGLVQLKTTKVVKTKERWWLRAALLAAIAIGSVIAYFVSQNSSTGIPFGNATIIEPAVPGSQYQIIK